MAETPMPCARAWCAYWNVPSLGSRQELSHYLARHIGESEVAALEAVDEAGVVESEEVEDRCLKIMDVDGILGNAEAEVVGSAEGDAGLDATACQPHGIGVAVVVAADGSLVLAHWRTAKFAAP